MARITFFADNIKSVFNEYLRETNLEFLLQFKIVNKLFTLDIFLQTICYEF